MNYNNYDSKGNEKGFDYSLLFSDKKYRARLILVIYLIFFVVLIVLVRNGNNSSSSLNNNEFNNNGVIIDDEDNSDENNEVSDEYLEEFSSIMSNNYKFEFTIVSDSNTFVATGKRYNEKYDLKLTDGESIIRYLSDGNRVNAESDGEYYDTNLPFYCINYFDNDVLYNIVSSSVEVSDNVYAISNKNLYKYIDSLYKKELTDSDSINTIKIIKENNVIISLDIDITNMVNSLGITSTSSTIVSLKYYNFNLVNDFEINF